MLAPRPLQGRKCWLQGHYKPVSTTKCSTTALHYLLHHASRSTTSNAPVSRTPEVPLFIAPFTCALLYPIHELALHLLVPPVPHSMGPVTPPALLQATHLRVSTFAAACHWMPVLHGAHIHLVCRSEQFDYIGSPMLDVSTEFLQGELGSDCSIRTGSAIQCILQLFFSLCLRCSRCICGPT